MSENDTFPADGVSFSAGNDLIPPSLADEALVCSPSASCYVNLAPDIIVDLVHPPTIENSSRNGSLLSSESNRAIPMLILTIGRKRFHGTELLVSEYKEKIKYYNEIEVIHVKSNPKHTSDVGAQVEAEDITIMQHLRPDYLVVVLDELGKEIGSHQLADLVGDAGGTVMDYHQRSEIPSLGYSVKDICLFSTFKDAILHLALIEISNQLSIKCEGSIFGFIWPVVTFLVNHEQIWRI